MINADRLAITFRDLVSFDSVSKNEGAVANAIRKILEALGAQVIVDKAGEKIGSNTGNLIAKFEGNKAVPPLLLNAHMDTVDPGQGVKVVFKNGIFNNKGFF